MRNKKHTEQIVLCDRIGAMYICDAIRGSFSHQIAHDPYSDSLIVAIANASVYKIDNNKVTHLPPPTLIMVQWEGLQAEAKESLSRELREAGLPSAIKAFGNAEIYIEDEPLFVSSYRELEKYEQNLYNEAKNGNQTNTCRA